MDTMVPVHGPFLPDQLEEWKSQGYFDGLEDGQIICFVKNSGYKGVDDSEWKTLDEIDRFN